MLAFHNSLHELRQSHITDSLAFHIPGSRGIHLDIFVLSNTAVTLLETPFGSARAERSHHFPDFGSLGALMSACVAWCRRPAFHTLGNQHLLHFMEEFASDIGIALSAMKPALPSMLLGHIPTATINSNQPMPRHPLAMPNVMPMPTSDFQQYLPEVCRVPSSSGSDEALSQSPSRFPAVNLPSDSQQISSLIENISLSEAFDCIPRFGKQVAVELIAQVVGEPNAKELSRPTIEKLKQQDKLVVESGIIVGAHDSSLDGKNSDWKGPGFSRNIGEDRHSLSNVWVKVNDTFEEKQMQNTKALEELIADPSMLATSPPRNKIEQLHDLGTKMSMESVADVNAEHPKFGASRDSVGMGGRGLVRGPSMLKIYDPDDGVEQAHEPRIRKSMSIRPSFLSPATAVNRRPSLSITLDAAEPRVARASRVPSLPSHVNFRTLRELDGATLSRKMAERKRYKINLLTTNWRPITGNECYYSSFKDRTISAYFDSDLDLFMRQCVALGKGYMIVNLDNVVAFHDIPESLASVLEDRRAARIKSSPDYGVLGPGDSFFIRFLDGHATWSAPQSFSDAVTEDTDDISKVAFGENNCWIVLYQNGETKWDDIPRNLAKIICDRPTSLPKVVDVCLGPDKQWFVMFEDEKWEAALNNKDLDKSIDHMLENGGEVARIVFGHNAETWFLLGR